MRELITGSLLVLDSAWGVFTAMAPYLLFGFAMAGVLHVLLPAGFIERHLGGRGWLPVLKAALFGIPLPLCSCSVIPVTAALRTHGASRGATSAFLLSTPQTGVDSILVTYSLLGPVMALYRPVVALLMGIAGGCAADAFVKRDAEGSELATAACTDPECGCHEPQGRAAVSANSGSAHAGEVACDDDCGCGADGAVGGAAPRPRSPAVRMLRYAFLTLPRDIGKPLLFGMAIAAAISAAVPEHFFAPYLGGGILPMLVLMLIGIPMYVCATASVPIAAALIMAGVSPGAALVFLISGPVTNAAEISALWKVLGRRTVAVYLTTVVVGSLAAGLALDWLIHLTGWRVVPAAATPLMEQVNIAAALVMLAVFVVALWPQRKPVAPAGVSGVSSATASAGGIAEELAMEKATLMVQGMTCNGCVNSVQRVLASEPGVEGVEVDLASGKADVRGQDLQLAALVAAVERLGYKAQPVA
jgi:uncharacterized membrane protein YraQ (UPF0718 family)/copper chaperone CopZ